MTPRMIATGFSGSTETAPAADLEEAVQALEERALERQARLEAALIQVIPLPGATFFSHLGSRRIPNTSPSSSSC